MAEYKVYGDIGVICINNPPVNTLSISTSKALMRCIRLSSEDDTVAVLLTAAGKQFSAGADVTEFQDQSEECIGLLISVADSLEASAKPFVAVLHGYALGGGLELPLSCHYRVAHSNTQLGLPEVKLGIIPTVGGTQRLPRLVGLDTAMEWIAHGRSYDAVSAKKLGIIDLVVSTEEDLLETAIAYARSVSKKSLHDRRASLKSIKDVKNLEMITTKHMVAFHKKARGQIAPGVCIQASHFGAKTTFAKGMEKEAELFKMLVTSGQFKGMRHSFFGDREVQKWSVPGKSVTWKTTKPLKIMKGAVIGLGTMGRGIVINFLRAGIPVMIVERDEKSLKTGHKDVTDIIASMVTHGVITQEQGAMMGEAIIPTLDYDKLHDVDLVIEAVFEEIDIKKVILQKLDKSCKRSAIIASNTSALNIDKLAGFTDRLEKVMGMHFFAPADRMTLLENVYGSMTSPETIATCMEMGRKMKKVTVLVGNCYGFVANRLYINYMNEADFLLEEGAYPSDIDKALTDYGFAMGRYLVGDLSGNDVLYRVRRSTNLTLEQQSPWCNETEREGKRYSPLSDLLYAKKRYGFKTGKGWHDYKPGNPNPVPSAEVMKMIDEFRARNSITARRIDHEEIIERMLYSLINEGFKTLDEGYASKPVDIDMIWIHGYAWPKHTGGPMFYAHVVGLPKVLNAIQKYYAMFGDAVPHWKPSEMLIRIVQECGNPSIDQWMKYSSAYRGQNSHL